MSADTGSEFDCCLVTYGNTRPSLLYRLRSALRMLRMPVPPAAAIVVPYDELASPAFGQVFLTVGYGGRLDVGGRLTLGPGCTIRGRAGGGFVIEMPSALDADLDAFGR